MNYNVNESPFWYKKGVIPDDVKENLKKKVDGTLVDYLDMENKLKLYQVSPEVFKEVFVINRYYLYNGEYTEYPDINDYMNATCYLLEDGLAGFVITDDGWLISLFSNSDSKGFSKVIAKYIKDGAKKLVCIVTNSDEENKLVNLYKNEYGFIIMAKSLNDENAMRECYGDKFIDLFISNNGIPHHVFMVNSKYYNETDVKTLSDYYEAKEYFDGIVDDYIKNEEEIKNNI